MDFDDIPAADDTTNMEIPQYDSNNMEMPQHDIIPQYDAPQLTPVNVMDDVLPEPEPEEDALT